MAKKKLYICFHLGMHTNSITQDLDQNKAQKNDCETKRLIANKMCLLTVVIF
jgi:hypothetical protein